MAVGNRLPRTLLDSAFQCRKDSSHYPVCPGVVAVAVVVVVCPASRYGRVVEEAILALVGEMSLVSLVRIVVVAHQ
jgi:hypothetical protein